MNIKLTVSPKIIAHSYKNERNLVEYAIFLPFHPQTARAVRGLADGADTPTVDPPIKCTADFAICSQVRSVHLLGNCINHCQQERNASCCLASGSAECVFLDYTKCGW